MSEIFAIPTISGVISGIESISGTLAETESISGTVSQELVHNKYEGSYEVTPHTYEQILETADKFMVLDLVVTEIPYSETTNIGGGKTINIAYEP